MEIYIWKSFQLQFYSIIKSNTRKGINLQAAAAAAAVNTFANKIVRSKVVTKFHSAPYDHLQSRSFFPRLNINETAIEKTNSLTKSS